jgi:hypothetical protein
MGEGDRPPKSGWWWGRAEAETVWVGRTLTTRAVCAPRVDMLQLIFLALVSGGLAAFMMNRLYVLFTQHKIDVKGFIYSREDSPIYYWFWVGAAIFGLFAGLGLLILSVGVLTGHIP